MLIMIRQQLQNKCLINIFENGKSGPSSNTCEDQSRQKILDGIIRKQENKREPQPSKPVPLIPVFPIFQNKRSTTQRSFHSIRIHIDEKVCKRIFDIKKRSS